MAEALDGCVKPAKGVLDPVENKTGQSTQTQKEEKNMIAQCRGKG